MVVALFKMVVNLIQVLVYVSIILYPSHVFKAPQISDTDMQHGTSLGAGNIPRILAR